MSPVYIKTRTVKTGKRYVVYWRRGGRSFPELYAGSFKTMKDARARRDLIGGELAAGRDPAILLARLKTPPAAPPSLPARWDDFIASRRDVADSTRALYANARDRWTPHLPDDPVKVTVADIDRGIHALISDGLAASTVHQYTSTLSQVLDFCDVAPNPVASPKLKLPKLTVEEIHPPTTREWVAIREQIRPRSLLVLRLIEACAFRISEACSLLDGDIDYVDGKIRVSRSRTKTASGQRWIPVPDELLDLLAEIRAVEDRAADRRTFNVASDQVRYDLYRACSLGGVTAHGPHDLRHRRISLWLRHGFDPVTVSYWAGHARSSMSLDVYGHVVLDPREDEWRDFWLDAYEGTRRSPGAAPVRHEDPEGGPD